MPEIVPLPGKTPPRKRRGPAPRALTIADMLTMSPDEVASLVHSGNRDARRVLALSVPDPEPARPVTGARGMLHISYDTENPHRAEHARNLNMRSRRIIGIGEFAGYYEGT